jgi:hypothetical protein
MYVIAEIVHGEVGEKGVVLVSHHPDVSHETQLIHNKEPFESSSSA